MLGTGGYHPSEDRHTACLMFPEAGLLFDAGTAAFRIPRRLGTTSLDIFLTHAHLDHIIGLTYLVAPLATKQLETVRLHATENVLSAVREHLFSPALFPVVPAFEMRPLVESSIVLGGVTIRWQILPSHSGTSMAYRIDVPGAGSLAYVTDTAVDGSYTEFIRGADVLIHECYFPDAMQQWATKTGHSTTSQVLAVAAEARVGRLVLVHIDPRSTGDDPLDLAHARPQFASVEVARDGLEIEF